MAKIPHSTTNKLVAERGNAKLKLGINSDVAQKLLSDCGVAPEEVQCDKRDGTALINAWYALIDGQNVTYCHSVKTLDGRTHVRDMNGSITSMKKDRDAFIRGLLKEYLEKRPMKAGALPSGNTPVPALS